MHFNSKPLDRAWTLDEMRQLYRIIDQFLPLPEELEQELAQRVRRYAETNGMPFIPYIERKAYEEGRRETLLEALETVLEYRFGEAGIAFAKELSAGLSMERLREIQRAALHSSQTIDDLRAMLSK